MDRVLEREIEHFLSSRPCPDVRMVRDPSTDRCHKRCDPGQAYVEHEGCVAQHIDPKAEQAIKRSQIKCPPGYMPNNQGKCQEISKSSLSSFMDYLLVEPFTSIELRSACQEILTCDCPDKATCSCDEKEEDK